MDEDGAEKVYVTALNAPAVNVGVSVVAESTAAPGSTRSTSARSTRTRFRATRARRSTSTRLTYDYLDPIGAAGASFPRQQTFYFSVDSGRDRVQRAVARRAATSCARG